MNLLVKLTLWSLLLLPIHCWAELPTQFIADFATHSGYIIMPIGDEFLVDLDASVNLKEGDILTLVMPGEKVVHPISKEILGSLDIPQGYLQVTRIKSGYSYAKLLYAETPPQKGDPIRRFEQVPANFVDRQNTDGQLRGALKDSLPQLRWLEDGSDEQPLLTFAHEGQTLSVKSSSGSPLRTYTLVDGLPVAPRSPKAQSFNELNKQEPKMLQKAANKLLDTLMPSKDDRELEASRAIIRQAQDKKAGLWMGASIAGHPVAVVVAELDGGTGQETAIAMDNRLIIARVAEGKYLEEEVLEMPFGTSILSLDAADLDGNNRAELYLTAVRDGAITSLVIENNGNGYQKTIDKINWYLRAVELPNEGTILLGQSPGENSQQFTGNPFRISRTGNKLTKGAPFPLPNFINLYSFVPFTDQAGKLFYAYLSESDYLKVTTDEGMILWESGDYFGGSETRFDLSQKITQAEELTEPIYVGPRLLIGPDNEIMIIQNDGLRTLQRFRMFKESRLIAMTWNGQALTESWRTAEQKGYMGDFTVADIDNDGSTELVLAMKFKHKGLLQEARSALVTYQLN